MASSKIDLIKRKVDLAGEIEKREGWLERE
jgi:hypothetical protein